MTRPSFKSFLVEQPPTHDETLKPGPVRAIRDHDHEKALLKRGHARPVHKSDKIEVIRLRNAEAAKYYGSGTHWGHDVREDEKYFEEYIKPHDPHLVLTIKGRKFLVYPKEKVVYNEAYERVNAFHLAAKHPELRDVFNELAEKHTWIPFLKRDPKHEDWEVKGNEKEIADADMNDLPTKVVTAFMHKASRDVEFMKKHLEQLSYDKALEVARDGLGNTTFLKLFINLYHGRKGRHPIADLAKLIEDGKDLQVVAKAVYGEMFGAPSIDNIELPPELEVKLLNALSDYDIKDVLKQLESGRVKFSDAGWGKLVEKAPHEVLELHQKNKSLVPQKFLQQAQWHRFKKVHK